MVSMVETFDYFGVDDNFFNDRVRDLGSSLNLFAGNRKRELSLHFPFTVLSLKTVRPFIRLFIEPRTSSLLDVIVLIFSLISAIRGDGENFHTTQLPGNRGRGASRNSSGPREGVTSGSIRFGLRFAGRTACPGHKGD